MAKGVMFNKKEEYELIEKRIVGYSLTTSQPADWATNYTDYFTNTGTLRNPTYTAVTGETAPTWESGVYYAYSSADKTVIDIRNEPNGTPYNFKKIFITATQPTTGGHFTLFLHITSASTRQYRSLYVHPQSNYGGFGENNYRLGYEFEIIKPLVHFAFGKVGGNNANVCNSGWTFNERFVKDLRYGDEYISDFNFDNCLIKAGSEITIWAVRN